MGIKLSSCDKGSRGDNFISCSLVVCTQIKVPTIMVMIRNEYGVTVQIRCVGQLLCYQKVHEDRLEMCSGQSGG